MRDMMRRCTVLFLSLMLLMILVACNKDNDNKDEVATGTDSVATTEIAEEATQGDESGSTESKKEETTETEDNKSEESEKEKTTEVEDKKTTEAENKKTTEAKKEETNSNTGNDSNENTKKTTETTTEVTTRATTEATTRATTEATTRATTEATTRATTEATTRATTEATTQATTTEATTEAQSEGYYLDYASTVLALVNAEREKVGVAPLALDYTLMSTANVRAKECSVSFSHTRPDGSSCFSAWTVSYGAVGENIAAGYGSAESVVAGWVSSPGHYSNMINASFTHMAVSCYYDPNSDYGYYWAQCFGGY